ncbi:MAG: hypothetical protein ACR2P1_16270 [Pseudomonadales bacterium]
MRVRLRRSYAAKTGVALALIAVCAAAQSASFNDRFDQPVSWEFMQNRGGIALEPAFREAGHWFLPVRCNVSGIKAITTTPRILHAKRAWRRTSAVIEDGRIYVVIVATKQGLKAPSAVCGPAKLEAVQPGDYEVIYRDPDGSLHSMGKVSIGAC